MQCCEIHYCVTNKVCPHNLQSFLVIILFYHEKISVSYLYRIDKS